MLGEMQRCLTKPSVLHQPQGQKRIESRFRGSGVNHQQSRKRREDITLNLGQISVVFDRAS